jgi:hypothetical protein
LSHLQGLLSLAARVGSDCVGFWGDLGGRVPARHPELVVRRHGELWIGCGVGHDGAVHTELHGFVLL